MSDNLSAIWNSPEVMRILKIIQTYTNTEIKIGLADILPLTSDWIFDGDHQDAIGRTTAKDLQNLKIALEDARAAFDRLHASVARTLEHNFSNNCTNEHKVSFFTSDGEPYKSYDQIGILLDYLVEGISNGGENSAIHNAIRVADEMPKISGPAKNHSTWAKVKLVENARSVWYRTTGKRAPIEASDGAEFFNFVGDLIEALGEEWDTESTIKSYKNSLKTMI
ncbi:hypothetical protein N9L47_04760 [Rhodobacteraceae bacterium]|nr:hypothetical protein [Paracoccaceae bacterium]